jgi:hypothetical protein
MNQYQEKAREIVIKMQFQKEPLNFEQAKQCAVICVNEIIRALDEHQWQNRFVIEFYNEVKNEI